MRPHSRLRKAAKWLLTAVAVPLVLATATSFKYGLTCAYTVPEWSTTGSFKLTHGILRWSGYWSNSYRSGGITSSLAALTEPAPPWTWKFFDPGPIGKHVFLPLHVPALLILAPAAWLWVQDARMRYRDKAGHCLNCGYDHKGLGQDQPCPECGAPPHAG